MHVRIDDKNKAKVYRLAQKHNIPIQKVVNIILEGIHIDDIQITVVRRSISHTLRQGRNRDQ